MRNTPSYHGWHVYQICSGDCKKKHNEVQAMCTLIQWESMLKNPNHERNVWGREHPREVNKQQTVAWRDCTTKIGIYSHIPPLEIELSINGCDGYHQSPHFTLNSLKTTFIISILTSYLWKRKFSLVKQTVQLTRQHSTQSVGNMPPPSPPHLLPQVLQIMPRNPKYDQFQPKGHHNEENPQSTTKMPGNPKFYPFH